jgi:PPOX class probable F420-dependent enzyme
VNREDAVARVRSARVGRMATVTPDDRPHIVPFVFALVEEADTLRVYWVVDRKPKRSPLVQRIRNLERNPAVEFVVDGYDEDWTRLWWVRCSGTGRVVDADDEGAAALDELIEKYPQYGSAPPPGPVVAIDVDRITGWDAVSDP